MSTLEEHEAEQAEITAACAAGTCDHPECHDEDVCRTCGARYEGFGDGYDGECPDCADTSYMDEIVCRSAPRWAWEIIDETLAMDAQSKAFDAELRLSIGAAITGMGLACENANDQPISYKDCEGEDT